jgi:hypothetical protein
MKYPPIRASSVLQNKVIMERLDKSYLHPLLEHQGKTGSGWFLNIRPPAPHAGTLAKRYLDRLRSLLPGCPSGVHVAIANGLLPGVQPRV